MGKACGSLQAGAGAGKGRNGGHRKLSLAVLLYDMESCKDGSPNNLQIKSFTTVREKNGIAYYNGDFLIAKLLKSISKLEIRTTQCNDAVSFNTCSYLNTLSFSTAVCPLMVSEMMPWSSIVRAVRPSFRCPFDAGEYTLKNATINMAALEKMAGSSLPEVLGKIYLPVLRLFDETKQLYGCVKFKASFINTRG
ncbi:Aminodeoxyfutalosine synthase [Frankliniella fusca]|uniref:Aminodeoxyfutalosine synthase n=1 Tax=Frankliniella fusca TaxID=407009 RepID=A0AAE1GXI8_9NEOP|nr:Aminodeoxyfutalosine synthase [Frankliniella fusca]